MITIKLSTEHLQLFTDYPHLRLESFTPNGSSQWGDCHFIINQPVDTCDYWMVIDGLRTADSTVCPPENVILFTTEPPSVRRFGRRFLNQFATVVTCQRTIKHRNLVYSPPPLSWYMPVSYEEVLTRPIHKTETMMMITSNKQMTEGHRKRYEVAMKLKAHFGDAIHLYGRGIQDIDDKWDAVAPHRYAIAIENSRNLDYFSEKLPDCFLTETFPFYDGCPNVFDYFSREALQPISIDDFDLSIRIIERALNDPDHYPRHLDALRKAKADYLQNYSVFAILTRYAAPRNLSKRTMSLRPEHAKYRWFDWQNRIKTAPGKIFRLLGSRRG